MQKKLTCEKIKTFTFAPKKRMIKRRHLLYSPQKSLLPPKKKKQTKLQSKKIDQKKLCYIHPKLLNFSNKANCQIHLKKQIFKHKEKTPYTCQKVIHFSNKNNFPKLFEITSLSTQELNQNN